MRYQIKYILGIQTDADGIKQPIYSYKEVSSLHYKVYEPALGSLAKINGCPRNLIDYLARVMNSDNVVHLSKLVRRNFIEYIEKITDNEVTYSEPMVDKAVKILKDHYLIFPVVRGVFQVNPEYFFKGSNEPVRMQMIKNRLEKFTNDKI